MYRTLYINSQTFVRDGTLSPLSVEANDFDMPKHMHPQDEAAFRRQAKTHIQHIYDLSCDTFRHIYLHMLLAGHLQDEMLEAELQYLAARHSTSTSSTLELSWKEVARAFKDERHQAVVEQDPALHVSRHEVDNSTSMHTVTTSQGERINLLTREFHDHDRVVLVAQQIQDDENHPTTCPQRHRSLWVEMTSMQPSGVCVVRVMYMYSQLYRGDVPCTLGEESSYWDFDAQSTPPHLFPNHARRTAMLFLPSARQRVREFVQQTVLDMRANNDRPS
ncbi:hypothetical protein DYB28_012704 [Aphanomyces astaci]|uniref:Uncharacterized protein n=1 Tax=Aphanomyces astaci TaxID=112090 RepID=A0A9X8HFE2_APHAT|nr:hypothetical protein DYB28_012704 [Aphanomyces astaci]